MPRLILFGGAPTTAELLADWGESDVQHYEFETVPLQQQQAQPEPLPAAAALSQEEQDAIEDSYECSQRDILPQELQYPGTSHQPQKQQEQCLKPISALRVPSINNASRILPRPSLPHAPSELSVLSAGSSSHVEDSYAATLSHAADPAAGLRLPDFRFNPDRITSLANCLAHWQQRQAPGSSGAAHLGSGIDILGFVAAVEPLRTLEVRNRGGQQSARLFKMELCDESVNRQAVGKLRVSAWDHVAESLAQEIQKGDVVWLSSQCDVFRAPKVPAVLFTDGAMLGFERRGPYVQSIRKGRLWHGYASNTLSSLLSHQSTVFVARQHQRSW